MIEGSKTSQITVVLLYLFAFASVLFSFEAIQSIIMGIASLFLLFQYNKKTFFTADKLPFALSFLIILIYNLIYYHSKSIQLITNSFLIFIVPLFSVYLYESSIFTKNRQTIILCYSFCVGLLACVVIFLYIKDVPNHHFNWYFARYNLENALHIHGTYISLWIGIAFLFMIDYFINNKLLTSIKKYSLCFLMLILLISLVIINSRMIIYSILFISALNYFLYFYKKDKKNNKKLLVCVLLCSCVLLFFSQRYQDDIRFLYKNNIESSSRYTICYCSVETIIDSRFFGSNNGLIQSSLNNCYEKYGFEELSKENINTHNQYLDFFLKGGCILFIAFLTTIFIKLKKAYKNKNYLYFSITLLFSLSFLTENILVRQYGIYIYVFCEILLLGSVLSNKTHRADKIEKGQSRN